MNDQLENKQPPEQKPKSEPIGDIILGLTDPSKLTKEEFQRSPDLLFHGTGGDSPFFSPDFDYSDPKNESNSHMIGTGYYTTPKRKDAELFSLARGLNNPVVVEILPYKAKMFDFRKKDDQSNNANVPPLFLDEWIESYKENIIKRDYKKLGHSGKAIDQAYLSSLETRSKDMDLRQTLSTDGYGRVTEHCVGIFTDFMLQKGYDGIIYIEGGDHSEHINPLSVLFYNLKKIGTYETWNKIEMKAPTPTKPLPDVFEIDNFFKKS